MSPWLSSTMNVSSCFKERRGLAAGPVIGIENGDSDGCSTLGILIWVASSAAIGPRAGRSADGSRSTETLWRHRAGGALVDGRIGSAWSRGDLICERGLANFRKTGGDLAEGAAARRFGSRSQCAAHGDAGAGSPEM